VPSADGAELVFVVDVSALTKKGFVGSTKYEGKKVDIDFDDGKEGVSLTPEMATRLHVRKGSRVSLIMENDANQVAEVTVASIGKTIRVSDSRVYYTIGREGGAVLRLRKS
jgi:ABC-type lipoprotein release transport system permease subunit